MSLKCDEISLWCDADSQDDKTSDKKARKKNGGISVRLKEDDHFTVFTEMHGDEFSISQQRLWAQTINCGTHGSFERFHLLFLCLHLHLSSGLRRTL